MQYRYETADRDYTLFAGGQVLHAYPGHAAFPARLASEIFQRCAAHLAAQQIGAPYVLYDPVCGAAAHFATIAFLNWDAIDTIIASDIDHTALQFASKNLALLSPAGMQRRIAQIEAMLHDYGKDSHRQALDSAHRLRGIAGDRPLRTHLFCADATRPLPLSRHVPQRPLDIVFADIPYGQRSQWQHTTAPAPGVDPLQLMLDSLHTVLPAHAIVAIASGNRHKVSHHNYHRLRQLRAGKRRVTLLAPIIGAPDTSPSSGDRS